MTGKLEGMRGAHPAETPAPPALLAGGFNLRMYVAEELTARFLTALGYDLPPERQRRIAEEMDYAVQLGAGGALAFTHALNLELAMYGDPHGRELGRPVCGAGGRRGGGRR